jgi:hypothetical protein
LGSLGKTHLPQGAVLDFPAKQLEVQWYQIWGIQRGCKVFLPFVESTKLVIKKWHKFLRDYLETPLTYMGSHTIWLPMAYPMA